MENSKYEELCRLCATKTTMVSAINIFEHEGMIRQISKKIETCLPVNVNQSDELPKIICEGCLYKLELFCDFRDRSARTENILLELYKLSSSILSDTQHTCLVPMDGNGLIIVPHQLLSNQTVSELDVGPMDGRMVIQQEIIHLNSHSLDIMNNHSLSIQDYSNQSVFTQDTIVMNSNGQSVDDSKFNDNLGFIQHQILSEQFKLQHEYQMSLQNVTAVSLSNGVNTEDSDQSYGHARDLDHESICSVQYKESKLVENNTNTSDTYKHEDSNSGNSLHLEDHISNTSPQNLVEAKHIYNLDSDNSNLHIEDQLTKMNTQNSETSQCYDLDSSNSESLLILSSTKNWFYCNICGKSLEDKTMFEEHYNTHFHKCRTCLSVFTSEDVFLEHRTVCVEDSRLHNTEFSKTEMQIPNNSNQQVDSEDSDPDGDLNNEPDSVELDPGPTEGGTKDDNSEEGPKQKKSSPKECKECGKTYKTNYKLTEHMRKHTGEKPYKCNSCEKAFRSRIGLLQHEAKHTGQYEYSCPTCGKGFQCKSYLIGHQRVHSNLKPYPCTTCGQNFKTKQSLLDHTNRHLGVKPYICDICGRGFITKGVCRAHKKTHTGFDNRKYSCKICEKMFVSKSYLRTHLRIHTGEKPYMCEVCGKGFLTGVDLKIHSTMHTGEKSFVCEMCGKAFARQVALRCHRRSHTGERPYSCDLCGQTFTQFTPMAIHKRLHTGERPYACETCGKAFVSRSTMMSHAKKHHARS